jgi:hypothetical protein
LIQAEGEEEALGAVIATSIFNGQGIALEPLDWVLLRVVLGDPERYEILREKQVAKSCRVGGEASCRCHLLWRPFCGGSRQSYGERRSRHVCCQ